MVKCFIDSGGTQGLDDYKVFVMNGKAVRTFVCMGRTANAHFEGYFYNDWHIIEDVDMGEKSLGKVILKPACFDGMLSVAETLTVPFNHARVDLYMADGSYRRRDCVHVRIGLQSIRTVSRLLKVFCSIKI